MIRVAMIRVAMIRVAETPAGTARGTIPAEMTLAPEDRVRALPAVIHPATATAIRDPATRAATQALRRRATTVLAERTLAGGRPMSRGLMLVRIAHQAVHEETTLAAILAHVPIRLRGLATRARMGHRGRMVHDRLVHRVPVHRVPVHRVLTAPVRVERRGRTHRALAELHDRARPVRIALAVERQEVGAGMTRARRVRLSAETIRPSNVPVAHEPKFSARHFRMT